MNEEEQKKVDPKAYLPKTPEEALRQDIKKKRKKLKQEPDSFGTNLNKM
ncbi:MAG: hypothetical protein AABX07_03890 [Nanoarchaeota archaeon]